MALSFCNRLVLLLVVGQAAAFSNYRLFATKKAGSVPVQLSASSRGDVTLDSQNRRVFVSNALLVLSAPALMIAGALPASADVSDGDALPQGAAQFGRVVRAKSDLAVSTVSHLEHVII
jgi:hypothetical protein